MHKDLLIALGGHIDHGKTSLIRAINGFDGDGSVEEKRRGITLDLSVSNLRLPHRNLAFIDVPGHEKLVKTMIAGSFAVDLLCLVIASDDGVMPQTLEHLHIANALKIPRCLCVVSKTDKRPLTPALEEEIRSHFAGLAIRLEGILPFSLKTQTQDLEPILSYFSRLEKSPRRDLGFFRCYVDRAFSISGAGCVVSGTVLDGEVRKGDRLFVCDLEREIGVRSLNIHSHPASIALPSQRVALNLSGINPSELKRGYLIASKGYLRGFDRIDVLLESEQALPKFASLHIGAKKVEVQILPLGSLDAKHHFATLKAQEKLFTLFGEPFVLRSDQRLLCGGEVLSPIADPLKKSQRLPLLQALRIRDFGTAFALLLQAHPKGFGLISSTQRFALSHAQALEVARSLQEGFVDAKNLVLYSQVSALRLREAILAIFDKNPQALLSASSLRLKFLWASEPFLESLLQALLQEGRLQKRKGLYASLGNTVRNPEEFLMDQIHALLQTQGYAPIAPYNLYEDLHVDRKRGDQALKKLCASQKVVRLEHNLFLTAANLQSLLELMRGLITQEGYIDFALFKRHCPLSRKYLIAYLDYLDRFQDIEKRGDRRVFRHGPSKH